MQSCLVTLTHLVILLAELLNPETHLLAKGCCNYPAFRCQNIWFAHAVGHSLHVKYLILPQSWDTQKHTVHQSPSPKLLPFISLPHPSSKLTLKWLSFIKEATAAARKNSIVIYVPREELQIRGWVFPPHTLCWLTEDFSEMVHTAGESLWSVVRFWRSEASTISF